MSGQVGARATPRGGFGNRVFSYLTIRHLARHLDAGYYFNDPGDRRLVGGIHSPLRFPASLTREKVFRVEEFKRDSVIGELEACLAKGHNATVKGALLGEELVRFARTDSRSFASLSVSQCGDHMRSVKSRKRVVAHLRAGDFRAWEPKAILPVSYYVSAFESVRELNPDVWQVRLCVDDFTHPAYEPLCNYLHKKGFDPRPVSCTKPFECDLAAMSHADILVSSPSSFALVAGLLGSPRVIHSEAWIENRVARGEVFWSRIGEGSFPGYSLEAVV